MTIQEAIDQLESLRQSSRASIDEDDPDDIFAADVKALDMAIEGMKKAALLEQETANIETNIQEQYSSTEIKIQEKLSYIATMCIKAKKIGIDCFSYYSPHVNHVSIDIYKRGWMVNQSPDISLGAYLDADPDVVLSSLTDCIKKLDKTIEDKCLSILNGEV